MESEPSLEDVYWPLEVNSLDFLSAVAQTSSMLDNRAPSVEVDSESETLVIRGLAAFPLLKASFAVSNTLEVVSGRLQYPYKYSGVSFDV